MARAFNDQCRFSRTMSGFKLPSEVAGMQEGVREKKSVDPQPWRADGVSTPRRNLEGVSNEKEG